VSVSFEDAATAQGLRKASDRGGTLRIVTIADLDRSACGGTHVRSTGEIGGLLIRGTERTKKAVRVEFVCGLRAVARARADYAALSAIATSLSTSIDTVGPLVAAQAAQLKESEKARQGLERQIGAFRANAMYDATPPAPDGIRLVVLADETPSMDTLRSLAMGVIEKPKAAFIGGTAEGQVLVATSEDSSLDAGKALREALSAVGGKGGGSPRLAQGSAPRDKAQEAFQIIRDALTRGR
jgi:alanyl-tRNA synthetase